MKYYYRISEALREVSEVEFHLLAAKHNAGRAQSDWRVIYTQFDGFNAPPFLSLEPR